MSSYSRRRQAAHPGRRQHHQKASKWRHSKKFWGAITTVAALVGTALVAGVGQSIYNSIVPGGDLSKIRNPLGQPPVQVNTVAVQRITDTGTYVFPDALNLSVSELKYIDGLRSKYDSWMRDRGGVDPRETDIRIVVEGNRGHSVQITDALIAEQECASPLRGAYLYSPGAGQNDVVRMGFNLDVARPKAQKHDGYDLGGYYFASHNISLNSGEQQTLIISARTEEHYCEFSIELIVVDGRKSVSVPVRNSGSEDGKFKVTADLVRWNESTWKYEGWAEYKELYIGGVASPSGWRQVDPSSYKGESLSLFQGWTFLLPRVAGASLSWG